MKKNKVDEEKKEDVEKSEKIIDKKEIVSEIPKKELLSPIDNVERVEAIVLLLLPSVILSLSTNTDEKQLLPIVVTEPCLHNILLLELPMVVNP